MTNLTALVAGLVLGLFRAVTRHVAGVSAVIALGTLGAFARPVTVTTAGEAGVTTSSTATATAKVTTTAATAEATTAVAAATIRGAVAREVTLFTALEAASVSVPVLATSSSSSSAVARAGVLGGRGAIPGKMLGTLAVIAGLSWSLRSGQSAILGLVTSSVAVVAFVWKR